MHWVRILFLVPLCVICLRAHSQSMTQIGMQAGVSYYLGDLNEVKHYPGKHTHFAWGIVHRQPINDRFTWKNSFLRGEVSAADSDANSQIKNNRNLSFNSKLTELTSQMEFNFFPYHPFVINQNITPYAFVGMGFFWINPTAVLNGNEYELRTYETEGKSYNKMQFVLPFGGGLKFKISHRVFFSVEYGLRKTFTDYIDDVSTTYPRNPEGMGTVAQALSNRSLDNGNKQNEWGMQRGNSQRKDLYNFTTLSVLIRLGKNPNLCRYNTQ